MSIRLRFTLLYNVILAITLAVFGIALYSIQSDVTFNALKKDLTMSSEGLVGAVLQAAANPNTQHSDQPPRPSHLMIFLVTRFSSSFRNG
jgi:hypothetical protein